VVRCEEIAELKANNVLLCMDNWPLEEFLAWMRMRSGPSYSKTLEPTGLELATLFPEITLCVSRDSTFLPADQVSK
jgi:hypothetical protein